MDLFASQKRKSKLENIEDIEILRFFDHNIKIKMVRLHSNSVAVDEFKDIKKAEKVIKKRLAKIKKQKNLKQHFI